MLVFNLRHMHALAWKTDVVVFSIIYSRVSWWAFSLQKTNVRGTKIRLLLI